MYVYGRVTDIPNCQGFQVSFSSLAHIFSISFSFSSNIRCFFVTASGAYLVLIREVGFFFVLLGYVENDLSIILSCSCNNWK